MIGDSGFLGSEAARAKLGNTRIILRSRRSEHWTIISSTGWFIYAMEKVQVTFINQLECLSINTPRRWTAPSGPGSSLVVKTF